jgi:hypothetical protein
MHDNFSTTQVIGYQVSLKYVKRVKGRVKVQILPYETMVLYSGSCYLHT